MLFNLSLYVKMVYCYCFLANLFNLACSTCSSWQESSGSYFRPQKNAVYRDPKAMELETAKEILAEVFRVRLSRGR